MKPKKITMFRLLKLFNDIKKGSEAAIGNYLYKNFRIQVSTYNLSTSQRVSLLYRRRRAEGLCVQCGKKVTRANPKTGELYRMCDYHRRKIDRK
jgi:hypothetical protein